MTRRRLSSESLPWVRTRARARVRGSGRARARVRVRLSGKARVRARVRVRRLVEREPAMRARVLPWVLSPAEQRRPAQLAEPAETGKRGVRRPL